MFTTIKNRTKGFTLIELLVVIAIIGILSSVVLASLGTARAKARDATRISDIKNLQLAVELMYDTNQIYSANTDGTANAHFFPVGAPTNITGKLSPTYIPAIPADPVGANTQYIYTGLTVAAADCSAALPTGCVAYGLGATLETANNVLQRDATTPLLQPNNLHASGVTCLTAGVEGTTERCYNISQN